MNDDNQLQGARKPDSLNVGSSESAAAVASRHLTCFFRTEDSSGEIIPDRSNSADKVTLLQERGKKSSFLLETNEYCYLLDTLGSTDFDLWLATKK